MSHRCVACPAVPSDAPHPCPLCAGSTAPAFTTRDRNRAITGIAFHYRSCDACGSLFLANVPGDLGPYYPSDYFVAPDRERLREHARAERYRIDLVTSHVGGGRVVEVGPGDGTFAILAQDAGFEVAAVEADADAAERLRTGLGVEVVTSTRPERELAALGPADAVVAWHVIEHVPDPWALLEAAAGALRPGGIVLLATPNPAAFGLRVLGSRWPHVDAPRHLHLLTHRAVIERGRAAGLEPVQLTATDPGGIGWNAFAWRYALRAPGSRWWRERSAHILGDAIGEILAPVERHGLRGAAYTLVMRRSDSAAA